MPDVSSGSLPRPLTSFIGREHELAQARRLLAASCLVTLTGPGGSGKTRLCIALAGEVAGDHQCERADGEPNPERRPGGARNGDQDQRHGRGGEREKHDQLREHPGA